MDKKELFAFMDRKKMLDTNPHLAKIVEEDKRQDTLTASMVVENNRKEYYNLKDEMKKLQKDIKQNKLQGKEEEVKKKQQLMEACELIYKPNWAWFKFIDILKLTNDQLKLIRKIIQNSGVELSYADYTLLKYRYLFQITDPKIQVKERERHK
jgi:hypothetical protein